MGGRGSSFGSNNAGNIGNMPVTPADVMPAPAPTISVSPLNDTGNSNNAQLSRFQNMTDDEKMTYIDQVRRTRSPYNNGNNDATNVAAALGYDHAMTIVDDDALDSVSGKNFYRGVKNASGSKTGTAIAVESLSADHTMYSGSGGSVHGRALYLACENFSEARSYAGTYDSLGGVVLRAKLKPTAKLMSEGALEDKMWDDNSRFGKFCRNNRPDGIAIYAMSLGLDGWYGSRSGSPQNGDYTMIINRGAMIGSNRVVKSQNGKNDWKKAETATTI